MWCITNLEIPKCHGRDREKVYVVVYKAHMLMEEVVLFLMLHVLLVYVLNSKIYTCDLFQYYY